MLPQDIKNRIIRDFSRNEVASVEDLLDQYDGRESDRVIRCIVHLSNGSYEKLKVSVETANMDYRDIILFAEYDLKNQKINDFTKPFVINE